MGTPINENPKKTPLENLKLILSRAGSSTPSKSLGPSPLSAVDPETANFHISKVHISEVLKKLQDLPREALSDEEAEVLLRPLIGED